MNFYMNGTGILDVFVFAVTGRKTADLEKSSSAGMNAQQYLGEKRIPQAVCRYEISVPVL